MGPCPIDFLHLYSTVIKDLITENKLIGERREDERATQIKTADRITYASVPILPTLPPRHQHLQAAHCIGQQP